MGCQGGKIETYLHQEALRPTYPPVTTGHSSGQPQQQQQQQQWMAPQGSSSNGEAGAVTSGRPSGRSSSNKLLHLAAPPLSFHQNGQRSISSYGSHHQAVVAAMTGHSPVQP